MRSTPYELQLQSRVDPGPEVFTFRSADGVVSKDEFRTAELLLANAVDPAPDDDVLVVDGNYGVLPAVLSPLSGSVTVTETSARAARLCERNARENGVDVGVELLADVAELDDRFDLVAYAPRPYDPTEVVRQKTVDALERLVPGGELYLAAARSEGVDRYGDTLSTLTGDADRVENSQGHRVYRAERPASVDPPRFVEPRTVEAELAGHELAFRTRPGLFSPDRIDRGTELLAETVLDEADLSAGDRLLDLACGYGPLGTVLAVETDCVPWFTDDSRVATRCTREGIRLNDLDPGGVVTADCLEGVDGPFDAVVSNPPTHAGGGVTTEMFEESAQVLAPGGRLFVVYNETLAYEDSLARNFDSVSVLRRADGYAVTLAQ